MRKILTIIAFFVYSYPAFSADYSLLYEEDTTSVMIIYYNDGAISGEIIVFGGYKWFKKTYSNPYDKSTSYIQPGHLGVSGDSNSWMLEQYEVNHMAYLFDEINNNQILRFNSSDGEQEILGYMSRNEEFSFSTISETGWYAGVFIPIKNIENLIDLSKLNQRTYCQLLEKTRSIKGKNIELNNLDLTKLMNSFGYYCNENYLLTN